MGGWRYSKGIDLSAYKYLVVELNRSTSAKLVVKVFDTDDYLNPCYNFSVPASVKKDKIALGEMFAENNQKIDPSHIYMIGLESDANSSVYIKQIYLSNDEELNPVAIESLLPDTEAAEEVYYDLQGRPVENPTRGFYIRPSDRKKVMIP